MIFPQVALSGIASSNAAKPSSRRVGAPVKPGENIGDIEDLRAPSGE